eukprot:GEMP01002789.1.p1 GENE.GEMP01002789.1~~GEMP01002789.1.p1  ORF type:complete len:1510 (+),score=336.72 GEMP01002789.1:148-4677(+)
MPEIYPLPAGYEVNRATDSQVTGGCFSLWQIFPGLHVPTQRKVSIFFFEKQTSASRDSHIINTLRKECQALTQIRHPYFLKVVEPLQETSTQMAFITEETEGSLCSFFSGQVTSSAFCFTELELRIGTYNILKALEFLHQRKQVVHRRVNMEAVYITEDGWKLAALGFVQPLGSKSEKTTISPLLAIRAPPEVISHEEKCTEATDVFCLAALLAEIYVGKQWPPNLDDQPEGVRETIERNLQPDPSKRMKLDQLSLSNFFNEEPFLTYKALEKAAENLEDQRLKRLRGGSVEEKSMRWKSKNPGVSVEDEIVVMPLETPFYTIIGLDYEPQVSMSLHTRFLPLLLKIWRNTTYVSPERTCANDVCLCLLLAAFKSNEAADEVLDAFKEVDIASEPYRAEAILSCFPEVMMLASHAKWRTFIFEFAHAALQVERSSLCQATCLVGICRAIAKGDSSKGWPSALVHEKILTPTAALLRNRQAGEQVHVFALLIIQHIYTALDKQLFVTEFLPALLQFCSDLAKTKHPAVRLMTLFQLAEHLCGWVGANVCGSTLLPAMLPLLVGPTAAHLDPAEFQHCCDICSKMVSSIKVNHCMDQPSPSSASSVKKFHMYLQYVSIVIPGPRTYVSDPSPKVLNYVEAPKPVLPQDEIAVEITGEEPVLSYVEGPKALIPECDGELDAEIDGLVHVKTRGGVILQTESPAHSESVTHASSRKSKRTRNTIDTLTLAPEEERDKPLDEFKEQKAEAVRATNTEAAPEITDETMGGDAAADSGAECSPRATDVVDAECQLAEATTLVDEAEVAATRVGIDAVPADSFEAVDAFKERQQKLSALMFKNDIWKPAMQNQINACIRIQCVHRGNKGRNRASRRHKALLTLQRRVQPWAKDRLWQREVQRRIDQIKKVACAAPMLESAPVCIFNGDFCSFDDFPSNPVTSDENIIKNSSSNKADGNVFANLDRAEQKAKAREVVGECVRKVFIRMYDWTSDDFELFTTQTQSQISETSILAATIPPEAADQETSPDVAVPNTLNVNGSPAAADVVLPDNGPLLPPQETDVQWETPDDEAPLAPRISIVPQPSTSIPCLPPPPPPPVKIDVSEVEVVFQEISFRPPWPSITFPIVHDELSASPRAVLKEYTENPKAEHGAHGSGVSPEDVDDDDEREVLLGNGNSKGTGEKTFYAGDSSPSSFATDLKRASTVVPEADSVDKTASAPALQGGVTETNALASSTVAQESIDCEPQRANSPRSPSSSLSDDMLDVPEEGSILQPPGSNEGLGINRRSFHSASTATPGGLLNRGMAIPRHTIGGGMLQRSATSDDGAPTHNLSPFAYPAPRMHSAPPNTTKPERHTVSGALSSHPDASNAYSSSSPINLTPPLSASPTSSEPKRDIHEEAVRDLLKTKVDPFSDEYNDVYPSEMQRRASSSIFRTSLSHTEQMDHILSKTQQWNQKNVSFDEENLESAMRQARITSFDFSATADKVEGFLGLETSIDASCTAKSSEREEKRTRDEKCTS